LAFFDKLQILAGFSQKSKTLSSLDLLQGHEKFQIIGKQKFHFDDLETTIEIFKQIQQ